MICEKVCDKIQSILDFVNHSMMTRTLVVKIGVKNIKHFIALLIIKIFDNYYHDIKYVIS